MTITIDKIGNGFMRRAGRNAALPPGDDRQPHRHPAHRRQVRRQLRRAGGLEVVRTLNDHGMQTEAPIEVAFWTNEEGSRFVPVMMGSGVFAGAFTLEHAYAATDAEGKSVKEELARIGYIGDQEPGDHPIGAYFETHIEQGPVLEDHDVTIGVVSGVLGIRWYDCTVTGMEAHAGPTPMALRKDALQVASADAGGGGLRAPPPPAWPRHGRHGAGAPEQPQRDSRPGASSASTCATQRRAVRPMDADIRAFAARLATEQRPGGRDRPGLGYPAQPFDSRLHRRPWPGRRRLGYSNMPVVSGAGHDAVYMAAGAERHDLHALQGRHQPQRD
jgi:N-carbamoyl-L-amino-acid hydrolase